MQAAGGIHDEHVGSSRDGGLDGVEHDRTGVGASLLRYEMCAGAHGPNLELLPGGGAERVGAGEADGVPLTDETPSEFPDRGRFPRSVDADHQDHA